MNPKLHKIPLGVLATMGSALLTSLVLVPPCCSGPLVLLALSAGVASISTLEFLFPYRWVLLGITMVLLARAFQQSYLRKAPHHCESKHKTISLRSRRILFWMITAFVCALISFPFFFD